MKVCIVNINNCIDYSQYGPFLYDEIKAGKCVIYNSIADTACLGEIYDEILADYNRNAFIEDDMQLLLIIPRNMDAPTICDYEIYNDINIYVNIAAKLNVFSKITTLYIDFCKSQVEGENHRMTRTVSENNFTENTQLCEWLPICSPDITEKAVLQAAVDKIGNPVFKSFFLDVLKDVPSDIDEEYKDQFMNAFAVFCAKRTSKIDERDYLLLHSDDIADNIMKRLKVVCYIKALCKNEEIDDINTFIPDYDAIKEEILTYRERLRTWYSSKHQVRCKEVDKIKRFDELSNARGFGAELDKMIAEQFSELDSIDIKDERVVDAVYEKLDRLVENADEELGKFSKKDSDEYFNEVNYPYIRTESVEPDEITESYERELNKKLNVYEVPRAPGTTERERLLRLLSDAKAKIEELYACRRAYFFSAFLMTFLFAVAGVIVLYFIAQRTVFMKEKTYYIFGIYSAVIAFLFFQIYMIMELRYKREIKKLIMKSRDAVKAHLDLYKDLAMEFEKNLNLMAKIACLREYLDKNKKAEENCEDMKKRIEWHKKKTDAMLRNIGHFDDFCRGAQIQTENRAVTPENYEDDAEHTEFYQIKVF